MPSPRPDFLAPYQADLERLRADDRLRALSAAAGSTSPPTIISPSQSPRHIATPRERRSRAAFLSGPAVRGFCAAITKSTRRWRRRRRGFFAESALFFGGGFTANEALLATLPQRGDLIVHDALIHASAHEGMRLSRAESASATHNDAGAFDDALRAASGDGTSLDRRRKSLQHGRRYRAARRPGVIAARHDAFLLIDEAHATGVFGPGGRGLAYSLEGPRISLRCTHAGKPSVFRRARLLAARVARVSDQSLSKFHFRDCAVSLGGRLRSALRSRRRGRRPAQRWPSAWSANRELRRIAGCQARARTSCPSSSAPTPRAGAGGQMQAYGYDIRAIRPPTVPEGTARLRIALTLTQRGEKGLDDRASHAKLASQFQKPQRDCRPMKRAPRNRRNRHGRRQDGFRGGAAGALDAFYWKPVQAGLDGETNSQTVLRLDGVSPDRIIPEAWRFNRRFLRSWPRVSTALRSTSRSCDRRTRGPLVIETAGGLMTPLTLETPTTDLLARWRLPVILVARTTLGTINHSLLGIEALRRRDIPLHGSPLSATRTKSRNRRSRIWGRRQLGRLPNLPRSIAKVCRARSRGFRLADFLNKAHDARHQLSRLAPIHAARLATGRDKNRPRRGVLAGGGGRRSHSRRDFVLVGDHPWPSPRGDHPSDPGSGGIARSDIFAGYTHEPAEQLARRLVGLMPGLDYVFYSDSGSTCVEVAIKMALGYWRNRGEPRARISRWSRLSRRHDRRDVDGRALAVQRRL